MGIKYIPLLKMKQNEICAISELHQHVRASVMPFFDIPRPKESNEFKIVERLRIAKKYLDSELKDCVFYLDNFDLDDSIDIESKPQYEAILNHFSEFDLIPVTGLYRSDDHTDAAINSASNGMKIIGLRLTAEDIESYKLSEGLISNIYNKIFISDIEEIHLVIDLRVITTNPEVLAANAIKFLDQFDEKFQYSRIIVAGSSIPANLSTLLKTKTSTMIPRHECMVWTQVKKLCGAERPWIFGDYGVVSPDYTDMEFDFRMVQNVATPKVFYTCDKNYFAVRGGAFKTHPEKYGQYFSIADAIVDQIFFRKKGYSFGEDYIFARSYKAPKKLAKGGSPSTWLKATLASHVTFVVATI